MVPRSRLVAAMMRTSTLTGRLEPTGSNSPSCSARSSLTCMSRRNSPISSRNRVPPSASWNLPRCLSLAPVNEPFSWPNRMDSTRLSGIAPQLTVTKGLPARAELFARAAFTFDQDRNVGLGGAYAQTEHLFHLMRGSDQIVEREFVVLLL